MAQLPVPEDKANLAEIVAQAEIFGYNNGLLMFDAEKRPFLCPFTLYPRSTPSLVYQRMWDVHELMQELYARVAYDHDFLLQYLKPMSQDDPFLAMLVTTLEQNMHRTADPICLISRSDYMIHENDYTGKEAQSSISNAPCACQIIAAGADQHCPPESLEPGPADKELIINNVGYTPLQVEFNSISTGFASLSQRVRELHYYLTQSHTPHLIEQLHAETSNLPNSQPTPHKRYNPSQYPPHQGPKGPAQALAVATQHMRAKFPRFDPENKVNQPEAQSQLEPFTVLMVVQPGESNVADQRHIEYSLLQDFNIPMIRASLAEIAQHLEYNIDEPGATDQNPPMWKKTTPISVVYYRSCYTPRDFFMEDASFLTDTPKDAQEARVFAERRDQMQKMIDVYQSLERSNAIKCPNIGLHLAGTKKVQQLLTNRDVLSRFVPRKCEQDRILNLFTAIWSLQAEDLAKNEPTIQHAIANPTQYVLKPMREGGGNNFYDAELAHFLSTKSDHEKNAMILMQRICPNTTTKAVLYRKGDYNIVNSVSEYGIFGGFVGYMGPSAQHEAKSLITLHNKPFGSLIRIKAVGVNEGGVAAGFSCLSTPLLE